MALIPSAILGLILAIALHELFWLWFCSLVGKELAIRIWPLVVMLTASIPAAYVLWLFRTRDVAAQHEQMAFSNNLKSFSDALTLLYSAHPSARGTALALLQQLRLSEAQSAESIHQVTGSLRLSETELGPSVVLSDANLSEMRLPGASLQSAALSATDLSKVDLQAGHLQQSVLEDVVLKDANLEGIEMQKTTCIACEFIGSVMTNGQFESGDFEGSKFLESEANKTSMVYANFEKAQFRDTVWRSVNARLYDRGMKEPKPDPLKELPTFTKAEFEESVMEEVDFTGRSMGSAVFRATELRSICFKGVDLSGADLSTAQLETDTIDFTDAKIQGTRLPYKNKDEAVDQQPTLAQAVGTPIWL